MLRISKQTVIVYGCPITYACVGEGEGEALVFVHGLSGSMLWWKRNISELAQHYRLYLIDLPGFGSMRHHHRHFHLETASEWLAAWVQAVGLVRFSLVGHSMGGYICMDFAARHPEHVIRLVVVSAISVSREPSVLRFLPHVWHASWHITPAFWPILCLDSLRAGPRTLWRVATQIVALDATHVIEALAVPTLLIWGENDDLVPLSLGQQLCERLSHIQARLFIIKRANHVCMFERPEQFNAAILAFLEQPAQDTLAMPYVSQRERHC